MKLISNEILVDSYFKAVDLKLEEDFVELLLDEIKRRQINLDFYKEGNAQVS
ncbi:MULTISPECIES: sporulation histidine kinase inhibitor Sda [Paenibacillus]|uniref:Sporulation histidine kinase inhibitor Sda n=1 Tax=Paenibacillus oleatilyticus TaxID=2594886 RepID=A0ABV4UYE8_9BACL|nr:MULTISPECIES: sporulation histidine kinase inhibitor Sda [Paenibacillus]KPV55512.1 sporulation inhibitor sda [Paenibacillus sp. A3]MBU7314425.1 sporulation histidine kinase inhibitor Sda [Paenibacillus oleatilyticus]